MNPGIQMPQRPVVMLTLLSRAGKLKSSSGPVDEVSRPEPEEPEGKRRERGCRETENGDRQGRAVHGRSSGYLAWILR